MPLGKEIFVQISNIQDKLEQINNAISELRGYDCNIAKKILSEERDKINNELEKLYNIKYDCKR